MLRVLEVNRIEDLQRIQSSWKRLWEETPGADFFLTLQWLQVYWKHFSADKRLRVILVLDGDWLIGIVPLVVLSESTKLGNVRVLTYPLADWATHYRVVGGRPRETLETALNHIRRTARDWDLLDLRWISEEDIDLGTTRESMQASGLPARGSIWKQTVLIELDCTWGEYLRNRSPKLRSEIRRKLRKFQSTGLVRLERHRPLGEAAGDGDPRWELFESACQIASGSWQGQSTTGTTLTHEQIHAFIRDCHQVAASLGLLDLAVLYFEGQPASFLYNYCASGRIYGLRRGDSPKAREFGMGTILTALLIQDSCERGDKVINMGPGSIDAKRRWMTRIGTVGRLTHYPLLSPKAQLLKLKHVWQGHSESHELEQAKPGKTEAS